MEAFSVKSKQSTVEGRPAGTAFSVNEVRSERKRIAVVTMTTRTNEPAGRIWGGGVRQPALGQPDQPHAENFCQTCGEAMVGGKGAWKCKTHGAAGTYYLRNPVQIVLLADLLNRQGTLLGRRPMLERELARYCFGCDHWRSESKSLYYCAQHQRQTGPILSEIPQGKCMSKAPMGDIVSDRMVTEANVRWAALMEPKEDAKNGE